jgi:Flp pilus assembly pilin Flp
MIATWERIQKFLKCESAKIPVEYAVAAALIAAAVILGIKSLGNAANNQNNATSTMLQNSVTPAGQTSTTPSGMSSTTAGS